MKKLILIAGILFVGIGFYFWSGEVKIDPPKNSTVVAFGDSLVQGVGATPGNDFVSLVSREAGVPILNEGRSGDTTEAALARISDVLAHDPGIVIVLLGGNDYLRRVPKDATFKNLQSVVFQLKEKNIRVLLLGVRGGLLVDTYEEDFAAFAKREGLPYVSNVLDGLIGHDDLMSDQIHPNDRGYEIIAGRVAPQLKKILGK